MGKNVINIYKNIVIVILFVSFIAMPVQAQISEAELYTGVNWTCVASNSALGFQTGDIYPGEAYWWGGYDTPTGFETKIIGGVTPGGYEGTTNRAGIDCSGFVGKIWGYNNHEYRVHTLSNVSRKIEKGDLQAGDILNSKSHRHVVLYDSSTGDPNSINVYNATRGSGNPNDENNPGNMVIYEQKPWLYFESLNYIPRRKGLLAPTSCSMRNNATDVPLKPIITVELNGPARPESVNSSSIVLEKYSGGNPVDGALIYNEDTWQIAFTSSDYLEKNTKYIFKVKDYIKDLEGRALNTDLDDKPGGHNLEKVFTTKDTSGILDLVNWLWSIPSSSSGSSAMGVSASDTGDNIIDRDETIQLTLTLTNTGTQSATSVSGTLSTMTNVDITSSTATQSFGTIAPGSFASNSNKFVFKVPSSYSANEIEFKLDVTGWIGSDEYTDEFTFRLPVGTAFVAPPGWDVSGIVDFGFLHKPDGSYYVIDDNADSNSYGNGNGIIDQGDHQVNIIFYAANSSDIDISARFELTIDPNRVALNECLVKEINIRPWSYVEVSYSITLTSVSGGGILTVIKMSVGSETKLWSGAIPYSDPPAATIYVSSMDPPDVFSPNGDGNKDKVTLNFIPSINLGHLDYLKVRIRNEDGSFGPWQNGRISAYVKYSNEYYYANNEYWVKWENGWDFPSGFYEIKITGWTMYYDDYSGGYYINTYYSNPKTIYLNKTSPQADNLDWTQKFSPLNPVLPGSATLSYDLTLAADTIIEVKNDKGKVVYKLADENLSPKGRKEYVFQSYDSDNNILSDGKYTFNIHLDDRANTPESYVKEFVIDHAPQDLYIITSTTEVISPTKEYSLFWTSAASPYGPEWNHLKKYQILGKKIDEGWTEFGVLRNDIGPEINSTIVDLLTEGIWEIKVRAIDEEGSWQDSDGINSAGYTGNPQRNLIVRVDTVPPAAFSIYKPYDGEYFDGRDVQIDWNPSSDPNFDYYEVCIGTDPEDIHGTSIYTEKFGPNVTSCEVSMPGGIYYIYVAAYDKAGNYRAITKEDGHWPSFEIDSAPPWIAFNPIAYPPLTNSHFSPNGDGVKDTTEIRFNIVDDSYYYNFPATMEVKVEILDDADSVVKSWEIPEFIPGWKELVWDGTNNAGSTIDDGIYTIRITAIDKALNIATDESLLVAVDTSPPEIINIANSGIFSPNGDGQFDADILSFELADNLSDNLADSVEVLDQSAEKIAVIAADNFGFGTHNTSWDGLTDGGQLVVDGDYTYRIAATDQAGNANIATTNVIVDTAPPVISDISTDPENEVTFTNASGRLDFLFRVSEPANVGFSIYDSSHSVLHDAIITADAGAAYTISWDGRDTFGELVPDNIYINYTLVATDRVANAAKYRPSHIVKVNTPLTGLAGNILYSPDGMVKIIIPAGAVPERAELYIDDYDTAPESYWVNGKDNITLTYKLGSRGSTEEVIFEKTPVLVMQYDQSILNSEDQPVELWRRGSGWIRLFGNTTENIYTAYLDKTSDFALFADLTPPPPPVITQPESPTKQRSITITGIAEPYSKVDLWINGLKRSPPIEVDISGIFTADIILTEGANTLYAQATDQTDNAGTASEVVIVELDTTPPNITLNSLQDIYISPNGDGVQDEAVISADTDGVSIVISVRDETGNVLASSNSNTLTWGDPSVSEGIYTYIVKAFDALGNEASKSGRIIVDKTLPEAYIYADPITYIISGDLTLFGIAEDDNFDRYILEYGIGDNPSSWTEIVQGLISVNYQKFIDFGTTILTDGIYTFRLRVYDKAGNSRTSSLGKHIINSELYGTISSPSLNQVISGTTEVHGNITGSYFAEYSVEYGIGANPASWITIARFTTLPATSLLAAWDTTQAPDGTYTLRLNVINAGNRSAYSTVPVIVDNGNPGVSITSPTSNAILGENIEIDAEISDANFSHYNVEYASSDDPNNWQTIQGPTYTIPTPLAAWETSGLNGDYIIKVTVADVVGNSSFGTVIVTLDNTNPEASIISPSDDQILNGTIPIIGTATDLHFSEYKIEYGLGTNPESWTEITSSAIQVNTGGLGSWDTSTLGTDGIYAVRLTVTDQVGNTSTSSVSLTIDNTNPSASITFPTENLAVADTLNILGIAIDEAHFKEFRVEYGQGEVPASWTQIGNIHSSSVIGSTLEVWDTTAVTDGTYTLKVTVTDLPGNSSSSQVGVIVDNTYPTVNISNPSSGDILAGTINIAGTVSDDNLNSLLLEYKETSSPEGWQAIAAIDPSNIVNDTIYDWSASSLNGDYTIRVTATDKTGKTISDQVGIRLDNTEPLISITSPTRESVNSGIVDLTGEISDLNMDQYTIKYGYGIQPTRWWDLTLGIMSETGTIYSWDTSNVKDGYYTLTFDAVDKAGNSSHREFVITIDNAPAVAKIHEPTTANQVVKGAVAVTGVACDADFTTYNFKRFEVLYGEGAGPTEWTTIESLVVPKINETLTNWNTAVLSDGTYTLKLRSQDISGVTEDTKTVVVDNTNPTASIASPSQGQTVSGSVDITGTASDTNFTEYKVSYKDSGSSTWTEIGGGNSPLVSSPLAAWDTTLIGDGSYQIKLWVKDEAGNEQEIARDVTVNNVLAVVNDSASPTTISPNGDGVDDVASINYTLSENSPVTVKIYRKPQYDKFKWEAKGYGTRYPNQSFSYTISASGTNYPQQAFSWRVDASGVEEPVVTSRSGSVLGGDYGLKETGSWTFPVTSNILGYYPVGGGVIADQPNGYFVGKKTKVGLGIHNALKRKWVGAHINYGTAIDPIPTPSVDVRYQVVNGDGQTGYMGVWPLSEITIWNLTQTGCDVKLWMYYDIHASDNAFLDYWVVFPDEAKFEWTVSGSTPRHNVSASDFGSATIRRDNTAAPGSDLIYSVTLSGDYGGAITGHSISYAQTSNIGGVSSSRDSSGWGGNTCSGVINASYNYSGDTWNGSSNGSDSCNALGGTITVSNSMSNVFGTPNTYPDYREYSGFTVSDNNPNVSLWFNNSGTSSTADPNDYLRASTSYSESWNTSNDPTVGNNGWIQSGEISLPFNYDESSQSLSVGYTSPSDVVLSSWTVNLKNPDTGGASTDVELDGTPAADGNFKVKIADSMLVKILQHNASTVPGSQTIEWDGKDSGGSYVADGEYIYYIYAGPNIVKESGLIKVQRSSEITSTSLSEEYISPNGDGIIESTTINYTLSETASVNIEVSDSIGAVIKSFSASGNQGANSISWDGTDNGGTVVEDGEYTIKISATHGNGALRAKELSVVVDNNSLTAGEISAQELASSGKDPVYSPDKSKIAYVKEISGNRQIFTLNLTTHQPNQLTTTGNNFQPHWSPDGTKITFTSDLSGSNDIWITDSDGGSQKQITSDDASETSPTFSPDGQKIAYASNRTGEINISKWNIWTVDIDGTNPTQITADENSKDDYPSWSPDGKKLAFASDQGGNFDIWSVNLDGSSKDRITSSSESETTPVWSPDGLKIVYTTGNDVYLRKLSTGEEVKIASGANPAWSRDGTEVTYNTTNSEIYSKKVCVGALTGIITQPILNQTLTGLAEIRGAALDTNFENYKLEFSPNTMPYSWIELASSNTPVNSGILGVWNTADVPDGEYILRLTVSDKAGNSVQNTVVVNADNDNWKLTVSGLEQITSSEAWDIEPAWSPDGARIAFSSNRSGNYDIWMMNADGTGLQNITSDPAYEVKPIWSPDGARIAFVSDRAGNKDIWVANADGSGSPLQLTTLTIVDADPTWSQDGSKIAFASNRSGNFDIWLVNSDGTGMLTKLTSSEAFDKEPTWSQFGIAFTSDRSGDKEIWMIEDIDNPSPFRLTYHSAEDIEPSWSPFAIPLSDGSRRALITFTSTRNESLDIWVMDTDGIDQSKSLTDYTNVDCSPAWSPDGSRVAYASYKDGNYDIWVMNFGIKTTALSVRPQQQTATLEVIDPKGGKNIETLRPTFEWYGIRGHAKYRAVVSQIGETDRNLEKNITSFEAYPDEMKTKDSRPRITYQIHEFDEGLSPGNWTWKVQALNDDNSVLAESDEETFEIIPEFTLTGITNYPNPFNPNRESTKIRYRLGATADEVKIRIYDITGALVIELDGDTWGEGTTMMTKYNDVYWNGKNGRGDVVVNGIYPFEVIARLADKTISGRGKVAVLK